MFGYRRLLRRLKSLEDALGLGYVPRDNRSDVEEHVEKRWGSMHDLTELQKEVKKLTDNKKK